MSLLLLGGSFQSQEPPPYQVAVAADSPFLWWRMKNPGNATTETDYSGNEYTGTYASSAAIVAGTAPDPADTRYTATNAQAALTSNQMMQRTAAIAAMPSTAISAECWMRAPAGRIATIQSVFNYWFASEVGGWCLFVDTNVSGFGIMDTTTTAQSATTVVANHDWGDGYWHYYCGTYDGTLIRLYIDGKLAATNSAAPGITLRTASPSVKVGYCGGTAQDRHITEVALYGYALNPAQIRSHYHAMRDYYWDRVIKNKPVGFWRPRNPAHGGTDPDLAVKNANQITYVGNSASGLVTAVGATSSKVAYWQADTGSTTSATDSSGNARTGTWAITTTTGDDVVPGDDATAFPGTNDQYLSIAERLCSVPMTFMCVARPSLMDFQKHLFYCAEGTAGDGGGTDNEFHITQKADGGVNVFIRTGGTTHLDYSTVSGFIQLGRAYVVMVTIATGSNGVKVYVDGILAGQGTISGTPDFAAYTASTLIGRAPTNTNRRFQGEMGHISIWSAVLTDTQVYELQARARQEISDVGFNSRSSFGAMRQTMTESPRASLTSAPTGASTSNITVSCWFRASEHVSWMNLMANGWGASGGWLINTSSSGNITWGITDNTPTNRNLNFSQTHNDNTWRHIAATYDGTWMRLYINGSEVASTNSFTGITLKTDATWTIAANGSSTSTNWAPFQVHDPAVFDTALSASAITELFESGLAMVAGIDGSSVLDIEPQNTPISLTLEIDGTSVIETGLVEDESAYPNGVKFDDFLRIGAVGNGRILVGGYVDRAGSPLSSVEWRANPTDPWRTGHGAVDAGGRFWMWVYGDHPAPWRSASDVPVGWVIDGGIYEVEMWREVIRLWDNSALVARATSLANCQATPGRWWWESGVLYFNPPPGRVPDGTTTAVYDAVFAQGFFYNVQVRAIKADNGAARVFINDTYQWPYETINVVDHVLDVTSPSVLREGERLRAVYTAIAKQAGDMALSIEDSAAQTFVSTASWGVPIWEKQMGISSNPALGIEQRRAQVVARFRQRGGSRQAFFALVTQLVGGLSVTDKYSDYRVDIRLPSVDTGSRQRIESLIDDVKPVGIQVVVNHSAFVAGISKAGDSL